MSTTNFERRPLTGQMNCRVEANCGSCWLVILIPDYFQANIKLTLVSDSQASNSHRHQPHRQRIWCITIEVALVCIHNFCTYIQLQFTCSKFDLPPLQPLLNIYFECQWVEVVQSLRSPHPSFDAFDETFQNLVLGFPQPQVTSNKVFEKVEICWSLVD